MKFIIDGYNLIGCLDSISFSDSKKEDLLIRFLQQLPLQFNDKLMCVFDGKGKYHSYVSVHEYSNMKVIFTDPDESADTYIINYCGRKKNKTGISVVTNDRDIIYKVAKMRFKTMSCKDFVLHFEPSNKITNTHSDTEDFDVDYWMSKFN